ncbi:hypothetical protein BSLG_009762 [Batrachochytrium salamandrivorans]|nr:hypothetical protein BSLG_009762 [Batrachochytrium salamandrivorans]
MPLAESSFNELKQLAKKAGLSTKGTLESLEDLSVKQLQAKSKRAGISTIGKKSALVNRLHIYYQDSLANQDVQISNNIAKEPFCSDSLNRETISTVCNIQPLTPSIPSSEVVPDTIAPSSLVLNDPPNVHSVLPGVSVADVTTEMFYCIPCGSNISAQHLGGLAVIHRMRTTPASCNTCDTYFGWTDTWTPAMPDTPARVSGDPTLKVSDRSRVIHPPITKTSRRTKFAAIRAPIGTSSVKYNTSENRKGTI